MHLNFTSSLNCKFNSSRTVVYKVRGLKYYLSHTDSLPPSFHQLCTQIHSRSVILDMESVHISPVRVQNFRVHACICDTVKEAISSSFASPSYLRTF